MLYEYCLILFECKQLDQQNNNLLEYVSFPISGRICTNFNKNNISLLITLFLVFIRLFFLLLFFLQQLFEKTSNLCKFCVIHLYKKFKRT